VSRLLAAAALSLGVLASAAPAANACDLDHCPWSAPVCAVVDCTPALLDGCFPIDTLQFICL
jgi:hypothetical protein